MAGTYNVAITDKNGCKDSSNVTIDNITAISEKILEYDLEIYPNPIKNELIIECSLFKQQQIDITIYDFLGNLIFKIPGQNILDKLFYVNLSNQPSGLYFIKVQIGGQIVTDKIVLIK